MDIYFVSRKAFSKWRSIEAKNTAFVDQHPEEFRSGVDVWIAQTFLRVREPLAALGIFCRFSDHFIPGKICIAHRDDLNDFFGGAYRSFVVGIRADRPPLYICQQEVRQNNLLPDTPERHYLRHWPQPGLVSRNPGRGNMLKTVGYLGRDSAAPNWFRGSELRDALQKLGVSFEIRTKAWYDYSDIDVLLAYRDELPLMFRHKPATKLYNAWLAGVPALLSNEPAFAGIRNSELDYIPVHNMDNVCAAIQRLKTDPVLYRNMIEHGARRARDYTVAAISAQWVNFICDSVLPAYKIWQARDASRRTRLLGKFAVHMVRQKLAAKLFRRGIEFGYPIK
ncbi:MAG: hypothetical protein HY028_05465 [Gammaproteobacteria bacterium]|nr:hypothetical protein [Gammaproteobacteria bacterium]